MEIRTAKGRLFLFLSVILMMPMAVHFFGFIRTKSLQCESTHHPNIPFTFTGWWNGSYQEQKSLYLNDSVGFRPDLLRLNNQLQYALFDKLNGGDIIGKDGYIFGKEDVEEYMKTSYMGKDVIREVCYKIKRIQDTLQRLGKTFVFTYAPSKAHFIPDKIPGRELRKGLDLNDYETFRRIGDSLGIVSLDFNTWFYLIRDSSKGALMTKQGFHWSAYGSLLAAQYLTKYIENERHIKMPELEITKMLYSDKAKDADDDLVKCTNLISKMSGEKLLSSTLGS